MHLLELRSEARTQKYPSIRPAPVDDGCRRLASDMRAEQAYEMGEPLEIGTQ